MRIPTSRRQAAGLGLSLLAHAAVIAWLAQRAPSLPPPASPTPRIQVTLLQPPRIEHLPAPAVPALPLPPRARTAAPAAGAGHRPPAASQGPAEPPPLIMLPPQEQAPATETASAQATDGFDLQAARVAARAYVKGEGAGRGGADGKGKAMQATRDEKLGEAIERSRPADCRNAYAGMGVLGVIPLAASTITGKGCKW